MRRPIRLGDACTKIGSGATPRGGKDGYLSEGPFALIRSQNILNERFSLTGLAYISHEQARLLDGVAVVAGDVLLNITGDSVARVCQVDPSVLPARVNQHVAIIRPDPHRIDPKYLRYVFVSRDMQEHMLGLAASGATRNALTKSMIENFLIECPPLPEQQAIAAVLSGVDDKIELNRGTNRTLEAMARALFRQWVETAPEISPPRRVVDLISEGILVVGDGYRAKNSEFGKPGLPFIRAGELNNGFATAEAEVLAQSSVDRAGDKIALEGDVAFTSKGTIGRFARVSRHTPPFVYSPQICFWRSTDRQRLRPSILYLWMTGPDLGAQIAAVADQSDMAPYVSLRDQRSMEMPVFGPAQHQLADELDRLLCLADLNELESSTLASLRDTLLPKLMSGELRVREAERALAEVA